MAFYTLRLPDRLAARFDVVAEASGGRSATLRALINEAVRAGREVAPVGRRDDRRVPRRIEVRLDAVDLADVDTAAAVRGVRRAEWIASVVLARLDANAPPPADVVGALVDIRRELRRIGVNLNQAVHAVNSAAMEGSRLDLRREATRVSTFRDQITEQIAAVGRALAGDRTYWSGS